MALTVPNPSKLAENNQCLHLQETNFVSKAHSCGPPDLAFMGISFMQSSCLPFLQNQQIFDLSDESDSIYSQLYLR